MENPAATLQCPNISCQAPNPHSNKFCDKCRTPLLRRYLWAVGSGIEDYKSGEVIAGRYLLLHQRILLDTKPAIPPETPQEIPKNLAVYLRLSPYGLHFPQVYGRLKAKEGRRSQEIWLLEEAPISTKVHPDKSSPKKEGSQLEVQLLPALMNAWKQAPAIRQLNWLWQIASLWQPLNSEGVASSLLIPELLRVEGPIVRLLELQLDAQGEPTLGDLAQLWSQLLDGASPAVAGFLQQIFDQLNQGQIKTSEQLIDLLDQGLKNCGHSQSRSYQIFSRTDTGPSRHHNEDACYPANAELIHGAGVLAIVCDGIGGHEGGEVASQSAIETLRERLEKLRLEPDDLDPTALTLELENAVCAANDSISQQNDSEHRSERQRMGTTLVMAKSCAHEMYITHVGDSRVYWITRSNCHQVTQDDDLASREVRLGYTLYRSAIQQPTSGSLVQALGMAPSTTLHPTVQRFVLDEDCVFLLCSDGLSDYDRVEQNWQTEILPVLEGQTDLATAGERLVEIANRQNGHDNVTIALVHCQVSPLKEAGERESLVPPPEAPRTSASLEKTVSTGVTSSRTKTQLLPTSDQARLPWGLLLGIILLLGLGGAIAYLLLPGVSGMVDPLISRMLSLRQNPEVTSSSPITASSSPSASPETSLSEQIQVNDWIQLKAEAENVPLWQGQNDSILALVPAESVLLVTAKLQGEDQDNWLKLKVCSFSSASNLENQPQKKTTPPSPTPSSQVQKSPAVSESIGSTGVTARQAQQGDEGWMREADIASTVNRNFTPTPEQASQCKTPSTSGSPTPTPTISPQSNSPINTPETPEGKQDN
ncbi:protein phosphatase 2C domain-containing protein [Lyngbya aestuarii]|uniref:protein phosphatase 2C domain-containing protein n=1 Tax=Lyngbya aestuarii TaxID=118322 RepID=UPI00403D6DC0